MHAPFAVRADATPLLSEHGDRDKHAWDEVTTAAPAPGFLEFYDRSTIISLFIYFIFTKGMVAGVGIIYLMQVSFCRKTLDVDARQCQIMGVIASIPWSLRGVIAVVLCQWKEVASPGANMVRYYKSAEELFIMLASALCIVCLLMLSLGTYSSVAAGVLLGALNLGICIIDVIFNGVYSRMVQKGHAYRDGKSKQGGHADRYDYASTLIFLSATSYQVGAILAASIVGPVVEYFDPRRIFLVAAALVATNFIPVGFNLLHQVDVSSIPHTDAQSVLVYRKFRNVSIMTSVLAVCNTALSIVLQESHSLAAFSVVSICIVTAYNYYLFQDASVGDALTNGEIQRMLASSSGVDYSRFYAVGVTLILLQTALFGNIFAAEAYFLTQKDGCPSSMPRFSYIDFNTVGAIISAVAGWLGIQVFRRYLAHETLHLMFVATAWLQISVRSLRALMPLGLFQTGGVLNWPFFLVVYCIVAPLCTYMYNMPSLLLIPHLIRPEHATTGYACIVSLQSYSRVVAIQLGLLAIELSRLQENGPCDFCDLWLIQMGSQVLLPLLCLPLLYNYIPKTKL